MADAAWRNQTVVTEFILQGFGDLPDLHMLLFVLFLVIYIATMVANSLVMALIVADEKLHTPMYFFLGNLSCLETCYTSTILPSILASLLTRDRTISVWGCITQMYFFGVLESTECCLLAVMSYDRYLAICKPLHYSTLMDTRFCLQLAAGTWLNGCLVVTIFILFMSHFIFCGPNEIDHFYCDPVPLLKLACGDTRLIIMSNLIIACVFTLPTFLLTLISYVYIIGNIVRIPSTTKRQKAFSTCSSHLMVVTIFYMTLISVSMLQTLDKLGVLKKFLSLCYTVLTPLVNPLLYSLRNREVRESMSKAVNQYVAFTKRCREY